ncbi:MAG: hypothetical protein ACP5I1_13540 [Candidatus Hinthialibacter sp.]
MTVSPGLYAAEEGDLLSPASLLNGLKHEYGVVPIEGAVWYRAESVGDGLLYTFPKGMLAEAQYLVSDILVDGNHLVCFNLRLQEGEDGPTFTLNYKGLNQAQARIRFPLQATDQNRWGLEREGAWLKPRCGGDRVDLANVDRMMIVVSLKSHRPARWCQTPFTVTKKEPPMLDKPLLPKGKLLDEMGQSTIHDWPGKTCCTANLMQRLKRQLASAEEKTWPESFSRWGGWTKKKLEGSGYFATHHDGKRWWLVDPDGYLYWSAGMDCVRSGIDAFTGGLETALSWIPDPAEGYGDALSHRGFVNYLAANFIRAFGAEQWHDNWAKISLSILKEYGFNTVANWSEWQIAREAKFPYVRPLSTHLSSTPKIYRDFPDVYHSNFLNDAKRYGEQLKDTLGDPSMIGYFLMNEPTWGFSTESPAAGMLFNSPRCETRKKLAEFLGKRYANAEALSQAWKIKTTFDQVADGEWKTRLTEEAKKDLYGFSEIMVERFFKMLSDACKAVDPHHLNLGIRYQGVPPKWTVPGMKSFDVFSMNCYRDHVPLDVCKEINDLLNRPVMIGEFHFGALDVGLPSPGLVHVSNQKDRGRAYRYYVENAAANPYCVGTHYFTLYDQSAMGRFDGENYNIGFLDICNKPYEEICESARTAHQKMHEIASGVEPPFEDKPEYLPRLF